MALNGCYFSMVILDISYIAVSGVYKDSWSGELLHRFGKHIVTTYM